MRMENGKKREREGGEGKDMEKTALFSQNPDTGSK